jgi:hypothetical protein
MEPPNFERCSILLTFQKLMISLKTRTTEPWTKQPRRDGVRVGAIWGHSANGLLAINGTRAGVRGAVN